MDGTVGATTPAQPRKPSRRETRAVVIGIATASSGGALWFVAPGIARGRLSESLLIAFGLMLFSAPLSIPFGIWTIPKLLRHGDRGRWPLPKWAAAGALAGALATFIAFFPAMAIDQWRGGGHATIVMVLFEVYRNYFFLAPTIGGLVAGVAVGLYARKSTV